MPDDWNKIVVLDTETTGTSSPSRNQILTIDAVFAERMMAPDSSIYFQKTGIPFHAEVARQPWSLVEPEALRVTGIDIDLWKGQSESEVLGNLQSWVLKSSGGKGYQILCGYNVVFDKRFLHFMYERNKQFRWTSTFSYRVLDVMQLVTWALEFGYIKEPSDLKLETVAKHLGVWQEGAHEGSVDVEMTLNVLNEVNRRIFNANKL